MLELNSFNNNIPCLIPIKKKYIKILCQLMPNSIYTFLIYMQI